MIRIILSFAVLFVFYFFTIQEIRALHRKEKLELAKLVLYCIGCATLTLFTIALFVITF